MVSSVSLDRFCYFKANFDYYPNFVNCDLQAAMLKQSSPPRLKAQPCKPAQLRALVKHSEESPPMRLEEAAGYFSSRLPRAFRVIEGVDSPNKGSEGVQLAKGE